MAVRKFTDVDFMACGNPLQLLESGVAVARGNDADVNYMLAGGEVFEYSIGAANTALVFTKTANGLVVPIDATNNEGLEMTQGLTAAANSSFKSQFIVGTDPAFYFSLKYRVTTVADYDVLMVGFRGKSTGVEDYGAIATFDTPAEVITNYDTLAGVNNEAGTLHGMTRISGATGVNTTLTTTWADAATKTVTIKVSAAGVVTAAVDGTALSDFVSVTLPSITVIPYVAICRAQNGTLGTLQLQRWTCGFQ